MAMVRKQLFITREQDKLLKQRSRETGRAEADLIRAGIDRELGLAEAEDDWRTRLMSYAGALKDNEGLEETIAENRKRWRARLSRLHQNSNDER